MRQNRPLGDRPSSFPFMLLPWALWGSRPDPITGQHTRAQMLGAGTDGSQLPASQGKQDTSEVGRPPPKHARGRKAFRGSRVPRCLPASAKLTGCCCGTLSPPPKTVIKTTGY